jgi:rhodanese-related sulfurtransferase
MQPRVTIPTLSVVEADAARRAPNGTPAGRAMPLLLDVRERHEFAAVRAPGAVLCPTSSLLLRFEELPRNRPIRVVCKSGNRSAAVTAFLLSKGYPDVANVAGGMDAWARAGLEVRRGAGCPRRGRPRGLSPTRRSRRQRRAAARETGRRVRRSGAVGCAGRAGTPAFAPCG